jgi:hypothetical protein
MYGGVELKDGEVLGMYAVTPVSVVFVNQRLIAVILRLRSPVISHFKVLKNGLLCEGRIFFVYKKAYMYGVCLSLMMARCSGCTR